MQALPQNPEAIQPYSIARLRRSGIVFLAAKGVTAPLNIVLLLVIAARMPKPEFALYTWLIALGLLGQQISLFGLNWIALHQVPNYRSRIGGRPYRRFMIGLVALRYVLIVVLVVVAFVGAPTLVAAFRHGEWLDPLRLYLVVMAAELAVEFMRSCVFEPLLEQGISQGNVLLQHTVFLVALCAVLVVQGSSLSITGVIVARGAAVWSALTVALVQFARVLQRPSDGGAGDRTPSWRFMLRFALDNYAQDLVRLTSSGSLMIMLGSRLIAVPSLAAFGFAQHLAGFVYRFLPAQLFLGLLRPPVIAAYVTDRSIAELRRRIGLILKVSNCVFAAAAAVIVAVGHEALGVLAGGQYASSFGLLLIFLAWLAIVSLQRMQAVLTNVLGRSELIRRASFASLLVVPTAVVLTFLGAGPYGLVLGMIVGEAVAVWMVSRELRLAGYPFGFDARGYGRMTAATAAAILVGGLAVLALPSSVWSVSVGTTVTLVSYVLALRVCRPFTSEERRAIESLLGRRIVLL